MSQSKQYCTFFVNDLFFGIEVCLVQEVIRYQEMTKVPLASREVGGLINLRGQIVTAIDLRRRLGMPDRAEGRLPMNVLIRTDDSAVSLLVDEIGDVVEVDEDTYESPPQTLKGLSREMISGVHKLKGRLLLILDTKATVSVEMSGEVQVGSIASATSARSNAAPARASPTDSRAGKAESRPSPAESRPSPAESRASPAESRASPAAA
jgi:purine-binding chemotaxis protein CheW